MQLGLSHTQAVPVLQDSPADDSPCPLLLGLLAAALAEADLESTELLSSWLVVLDDLRDTTASSRIGSRDMGHLVRTHAILQSIASGLRIPTIIIMV